MMQSSRHSCVRACVVPLALWALLVFPAAAARAVELKGDATPEQIDKAIEKAKEFIYKQMKDTNWETEAKAPAGQPTGLAGQWGGTTAICTYTLLAAGEKPAEARIQKAVDWLLRADDMKGIYALGMRANVWLLLDDKIRNKPPVSLAIKRDKQLLLEAVKTEGDGSGMYNYFQDKGTRIDHSVSQYGVLGMWAVAEADVEVPLRYWQVVENGWFRDQEEFDIEAFKKKPDQSAGWGYENGRPKGKTTASMTAAGVATLFITQDGIHAGEGINCKGNITNPHIEAGMNWMAKNFGQVSNNYTWYGVERIGVASGYKYFGTINWFRQGANRLVSGQKEDGSWGGENSVLANTCWGILFLERGRAPVVASKLVYDIFQNGDIKKEAPWNQRPRDLANLAKHIGKQTEHFLNWQIVNLKVPVEELHDAPILYISGGKEGLFFSPEEESKLKKFVEEGGLIVGNADCGSLQFTTAFKKLGIKLFPNSEFRKLPNNHIIFHLNGDPQKTTVDVQGLNNGARELMLLFPTADPARFWQTRTYGGKEQFHNVALNIFLYATDKQSPRYKGQTYILAKDAGKPTRDVKVARLQYNGNWDPEPYGWERLAASLHNSDKVNLTVEAVKLGENKLTGFKIAHLTGTFKYHLTEPQQKEIKGFVDNGGTLLIDSCGGTTEFTQSTEEMLTQTFGQAAADTLKSVPVGDPLWSAAAYKIESVNYRAFAQKMMGGRDLRLPRVRSMTVNGRPAVLFSREDLSVGLVGQYVDGVYGYQSQPIKDKDGKAVVAGGATEVMSSLVMFAAGSGPSTNPAAKPTAGGAAAAKPAPKSEEAKAAPKLDDGKKMDK